MRRAKLVFARVPAGGMHIKADQLTFEDFSEAAGALRLVSIEKQRRQARKSPAVMILAMVCGMIIVGVMTGFGSQLDSMPELRPPAYPMIMIAIPLVSMLAFASVTTAAQQTASLAHFFRRLLVITLPLIAVTAILGALAWLIARAPTPPAGAPAGAPRPDWYGTLMPHAIWVLVVVLFTVLVVRAMRNQLRATWEAHPSVARAKVYEITAAGVSVDEVVARRTYEWPAFVRFIETPKLLILCPSELSFEVLPKRAFASPADIDAARALFAAEIRAPGEQPAAFPVLPPKPPSVSS